jgi:hypothetical protein
VIQTHEPAPLTDRRALLDRSVPFALALGLVLALIVTSHAFWIHQNGYLSASDEAIHQLNTLRLHRVLTGEVSLLELFPTPLGGVRGVKDTTMLYPPLPYLVSAVAMLVLGTSWKAANLSLSLFVVAYAWALASLVRRQAGPLAALTAVALSATAPFFATYARIYFLEVPSTALVAVAMLALVRSDGLVRRGWTLTLAAAVVGGLYCRWNVGFFLAAPIGWVVVAAFVRDWKGLTRSGPQALALLAPFGLALGSLLVWRDHRWTPVDFLLFTVVYGALHAALLAVAPRAADSQGMPRIANAVRLVVWTSAVATPWYLLFYPRVAEKFFVMFTAATQASVAQYLGALVGLFYGVAVLLPVGIGWVLSDRERRRVHAPMVAGLVGALLTTAFVTDMNERYLLLVLPFAAWLSTAWLPAWPALRRVGFALGLSIGAWQAWGWWVLERAPSLERWGLEAMDVRNIGIALTRSPKLGVLPRSSAPPRRGEVPLDEILHRVSARHAGVGMHLGLLDQRPVHTPIEADYVIYHEYRQRRGIAVHQLYPPFVEDDVTLDELLWITDLPEAWSFVNHVLATQRGADLRLLEVYELPDDAKAYLFAVWPRGSAEGEDPGRDILRLIAQGGPELPTSGHAQGQLISLEPGRVRMEVLGHPLDFERDEASVIDPDCFVGGQAIVSYIFRPGASPVIARLRYNYYPQRYLKEGSYREFPPAPLSTPAGAPLAQGRLLWLQPELAMLEDAQGSPSPVVVGSDLRLPPEELFPGDVVAVLPCPGPSSGCRRQLQRVPRASAPPPGPQGAR